MRLGELVIYPHPEGLSLGGSDPLTFVCVPCLGGRAGSEVSRGHTFPQEECAASTLVGGEAVV